MGYTVECYRKSLMSDAITHHNKPVLHKSVYFPTN